MILPPRFEALKGLQPVVYVEVAIAKSGLQLGRIFRGGMVC